ncbi:MAG: sulfate adenylyltransferase subunit 1 [Planctomycetota bacterium]|jgi:sulfate adenylyltransferase large subunit
MNALSFVIVGHIDHGKSTLIGRLLFDTDSLASDKIEEVEKASAEKGRDTEFAYLLDHLEEERKQGITIDTTQVFFKTAKRPYVIIDAPGHVEFVKNMITGASQAEAAVLIIDVTEGVKEQTKRHSYLLSLLGLNQVIVLLNKMDLASFAKERFDTVKADIGGFLKSINIESRLYIPISAIDGDNVTRKSEHMKWYQGPTFLESLDSLQSVPSPADKSLVLPIQDVYKIRDKRINVGRVESGTVGQGVEIKVVPSGRVTRISSIEKFLEETNLAVAGECIGLTTADSVFLDRGDILCMPGAEPILTDSISATIFWMSKCGCARDEKLTMRCATQQTSCKIERIGKRIDSATLEVVDENAERIEDLEVAEVTIKTKRPISIRDFNDVQELGRFVLVRDEDTCAGGIITIADSEHE